MCPRDIGTDIDRCERILSETPRLLSYLRNPDFVSGKLDTVQDFVELLEEANPSLGIILYQLYGLLLKDNEVRQIIREECTSVEDDDEFFPFFMLFCTIMVYSEHIKLGMKSGGE